MTIEFTKKEVTWILIMIIILTFIIGFKTNLEKETAELTLIIPFIASATIILTSVIVKKIAAPYFNLKIEHKSWEFQRYAWYERSKLKKPFPIGLLLPFFIALLTFGLVKPMTLIQFSYEDIPKTRILKRYGRINRRRTMINDSDPGYIASWGFIALFLLVISSAILTYLTNLQLFSDITKYTIYYSLWNLIPISELDGSKVFFGSPLTWTFLTTIFLLSLGLILIF